MFLRQVIIYGLVIAIFFPSFTHGGEGSQLVRELVSSYFETAFNVPQSDIRLRFLQLPQIEVPNENIYQVYIESDKNHPQLGSQTLWLILSDEQYFIDKWQIRVDVSVYLNVVVADKNLNRGEIITPENITTLRVKIHRDYNTVFRNPQYVVGLMTKQVVKEGDILRRSLVREPPDIKKGDEVKIKLISGDLVITTDGKMKEEGMIGDKVKVICATTKKQIFGIVETPQLIVVQLK